MNMNGNQNDKNNNNDNKRTTKPEHNRALLQIFNSNLLNTTASRFYFGSNLFIMKSPSIVTAQCCVRNVWLWMSSTRPNVHWTLFSFSFHFFQIWRTPAGIFISIVWSWDAVQKQIIWLYNKSKHWIQGKASWPFHKVKLPIDQRKPVAMLVGHGEEESSKKICCKIRKDKEGIFQPHWTPTKGLTTHTCHTPSVKPTAQLSERTRAHTQNTATELRGGSAWEGEWVDTVKGQ